MTIEGGLRDRLLVESFYRLIESVLDDLGWFSITSGLLDAAKNPYVTPSIIPGPVLPTQKIPFNTVAVTFEEVNPIDMELGSNAQELTHLAYVDVYGQDEAIAKHLIGDIRAALAGEFASIGRTRSTLDVLDWTAATPPVIFSCYLDRIEESRVHRESLGQPWQRFWMTCRCDVIEERP